MIRRLRYTLLLLPALAALMACGPAVEGRPEAVACGFDKLAELPIRLQRNEPHVIVAINDDDRNLVLDTGAEHTVISEQAAKSLGLKRSGSTSVIHGIGGTQTSWVGMAARFDFGGTRLRNFPIRVADIQLARPHGDPPDGLLGADVLSGFDIDLDLPNSRMSFYRPRNCGDGGPNWTVPYATVEMASADQGRIVLPMELDNVRISMVLDTGAEMSAISRVTAMRAGRGAEAIQTGRSVTVTGATDKKITAYQHRFQYVRLGRLVARDPLLVVADLPAAARDGILGIDFMRGRRIWISYASKRIFVSLPPQAVAAAPAGTRAQ